MKKDKTSILVIFKPTSGQKQALINHLVATANNYSTEEGTEIFVVSTNPDDDDAVYVYEVYASEEAKIYHESTKAYKAARIETSKLTTSIPRVIPLIPQGGKGLK